MFGYIYRITNNKNGKTYIGKHQSHKTKNWLEDGYMSSSKILNECAYPKYGIENFTKSLICYAVDLQHLNALEKYWIAEYRSRGKAEYNIADGGDGGVIAGSGCKVPWNKGKHLSEEDRLHKSIAAKNRADGNKCNLGRKCSEETKKKISLGNKGKKLSEEQLSRIRYIASLYKVNNDGLSWNEFQRRYK